MSADSTKTHSFTVLFILFWIQRWMEKLLKICRKYICLTSWFLVHLHTNCTSLPKESGGDKLESKVLYHDLSSVIGWTMSLDFHNEVNKTCLNRFHFFLHLMSLLYNNQYLCQDENKHKMMHSFQLYFFTKQI